MARSSADSPSLKEQRQYHIGLKSDEVADLILLCGDPDRVHKVAKHFDRIHHQVQNREFVTSTGIYQGRAVSVIGTGIGADNTEIAVVELAQLVKNPTFIRIGSTGSLQPQIGIGGLILSTAAMRLENTTDYYVRKEYPAVAHFEVLTALSQACKHLGEPYHAGITATAPSFYGAQGREIPGFFPRFPNFWQELAQIGVLNLEMEASALLTLASLRGFRAGVICAVYANRPNNEFISDVEKKAAEDRAIRVALESLAYL
ncbi:MAG: nucleoside phosphorylase [Myxococcaceae bacterium]|nr:nucleoside phosphorylase [Myxococcaceae bacterium]MBH2006585.1 nucleoside phosphorylase [Myxococcaceae bacterium]